MQRKRFRPDYQKGDVALERDYQLKDGYTAHVSVVHGDPFGIPEGLRRLERITRRPWFYDGLTADQIEKDLKLCQQRDEQENFLRNDEKDC